MDMIEVKNLTKYYGPHAALKDVSFSVKKGEILGFLGPKRRREDHHDVHPDLPFSADLGRGLRGRVHVLDDPIKVKRQIGYLPENIYLYTDMTVIGYLEVRRRDQGNRQERTAGCRR